MIISSIWCCIWTYMADPRHWAPVTARLFPIRDAPHIWTPFSRNDSWWG